MTKTLRKLLEILCDGAFHSGEHLGKTLSLSRSAIWKLLKQLDAWDLKLEAVTNKGYCIPGGLVLLEKEKLLSYVAPDLQNALDQIEIFDALPSTNDYLLNLIQQKSTHNRACFAEKQIAGKGRRGRTWISPFAKNIYVSLLWYFPQDPRELSCLSLAIAIAVVNALEQYGLKQALGIKWPNDVLWEGHKLSGILVEVSSEANDRCSAVIGVGLNVDMSALAHSGTIHQAWTDVQSLMGQKIDRNKLAGIVLSALIQSAQKFQNQGFEAFLKQWQALDVSLNKPLSIMSSTAQWEGIGRGINEQGHLVLELEGGLRKSFASGEVSLRLGSISTTLGA